MEPPWRRPRTLRPEAEYESPRTLSIFLALVLAGWVVLMGVAAAAALTELRRVSSLVELASSNGQHALDLVSERMKAVRIVVVGCGVATAGLFIAWTRRVYRNLDALGAYNPPYKPGWAVGAWFVPFLNLVRPRNIVEAAWKASDPEPLRGEPWQFNPAPRMLNAWWVTFIIAALADRLASRRFLTESGEMGPKLALALEALVYVLVGVAAFLAARLVLALTQRQVRCGRALAASALDSGALVPQVLLADDLTIVSRSALRSASIVVGCAGVAILIACLFAFG